MNNPNCKSCGGVGCPECFNGMRKLKCNNCGYNCIREINSNICKCGSKLEVVAKEMGK